MNLKNEYVRLATMVCLLACGQAFRPAWADVIDVNSTVDMADFTAADNSCDANPLPGTPWCTLRAAVMHAKNGDVIHLKEGVTYRLTIPRDAADTNPANGNLNVIGKSIEIRTDGVERARIMVGEIQPTAENHERFTALSVTAAAGQTAALVLTNVVVQGNGEYVPTGGYDNQRGGGISCWGAGGGVVDLRIVDSRVRGFDIYGPGGGIYVGRGCSAEIAATVIHANEASGGGGVYVEGSLSMEASTIHDNSTAGYGGGIKKESGGDVFLSNVTITGNKAGLGSGYYTYGPGVNRLRNVTMTRNDSTALYAFQAVAASDLHISNSIIADNRTERADIANTLNIVSDGYNIFGTRAPEIGDIIVGPGDSVNVVDPKLLGLGVTPGTQTGVPTMPPLCWQWFVSPAVGAGNPAPPDGSDPLTCEVTDANGATRDAGFCDIGAAQCDPNFVPPPTVRMEVEDSPVTEGDDILLTFSLLSVDLAVGEEATLTFALTEDGAEAASDFVVPGFNSVTFVGGGPVQQTIVIPTIDDSVNEGTEGLLITASSLPGIELDGPKTLEVDIVDNDEMPTLQVESLKDTVWERSDDIEQITMRFRFYLSEQSAFPITVAFVTGGQATPAVDHSHYDGNFTLPAGETSAIVEIYAYDDPAQGEAPESVVVTIVDDWLEHAQLGENDTAQATILDGSAPESAESVFSDGFE